MTTIAEMVAQKYVVARRHQTEPLTIHNYTAKTQIEGMWNEVTRQCRGLILHDDGRVIARPYRKFFNLDEPHAEVPERFDVFDKLDGSLGITYRCSDGHVRIATRGSFESEQAIHATTLWFERYADVEVPEGQTWLFEIIYPKNRIVLTYGGLDDLVLHGCIDNETGADLPLPKEWPGPVVERFDPMPIDELLRVTKPNAEGFVLAEWPIPSDRPRRRVKVKLAEYVRLHKLIDGATPRRIWEILSTGGDLAGALAGMPDEFYREATATADRMRDEVEQLIVRARGLMGLIEEDVGAAADRKTFAMRIQKEPASVQPFLFALLSKKPLEPIAWKHVEPRGDA